MQRLSNHAGRFREAPASRVKAAPIRKSSRTGWSNQRPSDTVKPETLAMTTGTVLESGKGLRSRARAEARGVSIPVRTRAVAVYPSPVSAGRHSQFQPCAGREKEAVTAPAPAPARSQASQEGNSMLSSGSVQRRSGSAHSSPRAANVARRSRFLLIRSARHPISRASHRASGAISSAGSRLPTRTRRSSVTPRPPSIRFTLMPRIIRPPTPVTSST